MRRSESISRGLPTEPRERASSVGGNLGRIESYRMVHWETSLAAGYGTMLRSWSRTARGNDLSTPCEACWGSSSGGQASGAALPGSRRASLNGLKSATHAV